MTVQKVTSVEELLHELVEYAVPLEKSKFTPLGAYEEPLKASRRYSLQGRGNVVDVNGVVLNLDLHEQVMLLDLLSKKHGVSLRHGSLKEDFDAAYSPDGQTYKRNVLVPFWIYTGEMISKTSEACGIGLVRSVEYVPKGIPNDYAVFENVAAQPSGLTVVRYNLGPVLQKEVPARTGRFNQISGVIPVDSEIGSETGKGYWNGITDKNGLSGVRCSWDSDRRGLLAYADWPVGWHFGGVLGMWTDIVNKK